MIHASTQPNPTTPVTEPAKAPLPGMGPQQATVEKKDPADKAVPEANTNAKS